MSFRLAQNETILGSLINIPWLRILALILGFVICLGVGGSLATEQYVLSLGLLAGLVAFAILLFPYVGVLLFLGLTYTRPQDYVQGIMGQPVILVLMGLTFGAWLIRILISRQREFFRAPQSFFLLAFMSVAVLSCIGIWLVYAKDYFIELSKVLLMYFLIVNLIDTRRKFGIALWVIFAGTIYISMLGIFQNYGIAPGIAGTLTESDFGRVKGFGIFDNPNYLAYGIAFMIPLALYACYYVRAWPVRLFSMVAISAIFLPCIYFTGSRGGLLCTALTICFCVFQDRKLKVSIAGGLISIGVIFILLNTIPVLGTVETYHDDASAMGRVEAWRGGFSMLMASPLLGVGYAQFEENWVRDSHNSFVEVGSELGLIGLFVWIGLLYFSYKYLRSVAQNLAGTTERRDIMYAKSLKASLIAFVCGSFFASLGYYMLLYLLHSLTVVAGQLYLPEKTRKEVNRIRSKDLFAIGGLEALVLCVWFIFPRM